MNNNTTNTDINLSITPTRPWRLVEYRVMRITSGVVLAIILYHDTKNDVYAVDIRQWHRKVINGEEIYSATKKGMRFYERNTANWVLENLQDYAQFLTLLGNKENEND